MKKLYLLCALIAMIAAGACNAFAMGECGLSCCIAGAAGSGAANAEHLGLSLQYEHAYMKTIKSGTNEISPDDVIAANRKPMKSYSVPTEMRMQKTSLTAFLPVNRSFVILASVPYVINDMNMRSKNNMGMTMDMRMETVSGLGDVSLMGLYTIYADSERRPSERVTAGAGVKTPSGSTNEKTASGRLVHAMMQPGSGSWDPLIMLNYMRAFYPVVFQTHLLYQMTTQGRNGYEFGDKFSYDLSARYQAARFVNIGLDLNGIHAGRDKDHGNKYSSAETSMLDNPDYSGLDSLFISPVVQFKIPGTGGSAEVKYQRPIYQNVKGFQQVVDWRALAQVSWAF